MTRKQKKKLSNISYILYPILFWSFIICIFTGHYFYSLVSIIVFYFIIKFQNKQEKQHDVIHERRRERLKKTHDYLGVSEDGYRGNTHIYWKNKETGKVEEEYGLIRKMILQEREDIKKEIAINNLFTHGC